MFFFFINFIYLRPDKKEDLKMESQKSFKILLLLCMWLLVVANCMDINKRPLVR
jgi:hypothetical protein